MSKRIVLLQTLATTPRALSEMLPILPSLAPAAPGGEDWSAHDIFAHLLDVEKQYQARLRRVLAGEEPHIARILPDASRHPGQTPLPQLATAFAQARQETILFLKELPQEAWQRRAVHPDFGRTTLRLLVQVLVEHDTEHLQQLLVLCAQAGTADAEPTISALHDLQSPVTRAPDRKRRGEKDG